MRSVSRTGTIDVTWSVPITGRRSSILRLGVLLDNHSHKRRLWPHPEVLAKLRNLLGALSLRWID